MATKPVIISSSGLKNIVLKKYQKEDDFTFVFGDEKFQMNSIFAEFISPVVSHLHQTDPTITTIDFGKIFGMKQSDFNKLSKTLITSDTIRHLQQISSGSSIEIDSEEAIKLRLLSIILGNDELHIKLNKSFPTNYNEENINMYMKNIEFLYQLSKFYDTIDFSTLISFIASHFSIIDIDDFLRASREIQYMIISHDDLQLESEDSLFDIISQIIEKKKDDDKISDVLFYEQIEFSCLSENKFLDFISNFDFNDMSGQLWQNLCQCFFPNPDKKRHRKTKRFQHLKHQPKKKTKKEFNLESIIVGGYDECYQLGEKPNNKDEDGSPIISPPLNLTFDSSLLSYSSYSNHSVIVMNDGSLRGIGYNKDGRISSTLMKINIDNFTEFCIKDNQGQKLKAISADCYACGTLYILSKRSGRGRNLVLCDNEINGGDPVFLNIGDHVPVSLFDSSYFLAAIGSEGEIILINRNSVKKSPNSPITTVSLPDGEKASSVACCSGSVVVLSSNGRVFASPNSNEAIEFSIVPELSDKEIVCLSGSFRHVFAVSKDGKVFGCGSNKSGQLALGKGIKSASSFTKISSLEGYEIREAYAGYNHSLFETSEGKVLSCGSNYSGQLLLSSRPGENVYSPKETIITGGAAFCIAGSAVSVVLIGSGQPPNMPNKRINEYE